MDMRTSRSGWRRRERNSSTKFASLAALSNCAIAFSKGFFIFFGQKNKIIMCLEYSTRESPGLSTTHFLQNFKFLFGVCTQGLSRIYLDVFYLFFVRHGEAYQVC